MVTSTASAAHVQCPACHATLTDWSARCPKCRYHPDCDDRDWYNRAQDDVAFVFRCHTTASPEASAAQASAWRRFFSAIFGPPGQTPPATGPA